LKEEKKREARKWRRLFLNEELTVEFIWRAILIIFSLKNLLKVFPTASWLSLLLGISDRGCTDNCSRGG
jgi:hypothetical protein